MATLADYPDDWEEIYLSNPNFSMVEYSRKMDEYQRLLKAQQDSDLSNQAEGGIDQDADWADKQHEAMYPGHRAAANKAGFYGFMGPNAATRFNPRYADYHDKLKQSILDVLPNGFTHKNEQGEPTGKYSSQDYKDYLDSKQDYMASQDESTTDTTGTTNTNVIPQFLSTVVPTFQNVWENAMPQNTATSSGYNWNTPVATNILDVLVNTEGNEGGLLDAITAIDMNAPVVDNKPF